MPITPDANRRLIETPQEALQKAERTAEKDRVLIGDLILRPEPAKRWKEVELALSHTQDPKLARKLVTELQTISPQHTMPVKAGMVHEVLREYSEHTGAHDERLFRLAHESQPYFPGINMEQMGYRLLAHDIGKIGIPNSILEKPGDLTHEEYETVKSHPLLGRKILRTLDFDKETVRVAEFHHLRQKLDPQGRLTTTGYPLSSYKKSGLSVLPDEVLLASMFDVYEAMTSANRPNVKTYGPFAPSSGRRRYTPDEALFIMENGEFGNPVYWTLFPSFKKAVLACEKTNSYEIAA